MDHASYSLNLSKVKSKQNLTLVSSPQIIKVFKTDMISSELTENSQPDEFSYYHTFSKKKWKNYYFFEMKVINSFNILFMLSNHLLHIRQEPLFFS